MKKRKSIIINGYIKRIVIGVVVNLIIVVILLLIKSNYRNFEAFSNIIFYIGAVELSLGGICFAGSTMIKGNLTYQLSRTSTDESSQNRTSNDMDTTGQKFYSTIYMSIVGGLMIGFSVVAQYILL
jgi:hypothetical protein